MNIRLERINSEMGQHISGGITKFCMPKYKSSVVSVTKVDISPDLRTSKVFVSILALNGEKETDIFNSILRHATHIRNYIADKMNLKTTPELKFSIDKYEEKAKRIDNLLKQIKTNRG